MAQTFAPVFLEEFAILPIRLRTFVWAKPSRSSNIRNASLSGPRAIGPASCCNRSLTTLLNSVVWMSVEVRRNGQARPQRLPGDVGDLCQRTRDGLRARRRRCGRGRARARLEPRIGAGAYIRPGAAFAGGTLARDIVFLNRLPKGRVCAAASRQRDAK